MGFVSDLPADDSMSIKVLGRENKFEAEMRVPIGHDDEEGLQYSVIVALFTLSEEDYGADAVDVTFEVVAIGDGAPTYYLNGRQTKPFLADEELRQQVLAVVCHLIREMLCKRQPASVHMSTKLPKTPKKALVKYMAVCEAIRSAGYAGGKTDPYNGIDMWMFTRE